MGILYHTLTYILLRKEQSTCAPPLRSLRAVLAEGGRINYPFPELQLLRECVTRANEWVHAAYALSYVRKPSWKRPRKIRGPRTSSVNANGLPADDSPDRREQICMQCWRKSRISESTARRLAF